MKFIGGPWDGQEKTIPFGNRKDDAVFDVPTRMQIGPADDVTGHRWFTVSHFYRVDGEVATYDYSSFEWKP